MQVLKLSVALIFVSHAASLRAAVPDVIITHTTTAGGYATIAGKLVVKPEAPVGISVRNGNLIYSTLTDPEGRWGIVIRHASVSVTAFSWSLSRTDDRGAEVTVAMPASLPWTRSAYATGSSSSETSAKYQTETSLRWRIDQHRSSCRDDQGYFYTSGGFVYCNKSGSTYHCSANASCTCR